MLLLSAHRLLVRHVAAGDEAVVGRAAVHIEGGLRAHGQLHRGRVRHADGTGLGDIQYNR